jgi:peroxiredoxin
MLKRSLKFLPLFFLSMPLMAQTAFTIKGQLGKLQAPAKIYIGYSAEGKNVYDSADIENGFFQLTQNVPYPVNALLTVNKTGEPSQAFDSRNIARLYIEPGVTIWLTSDYKVYQKYMQPSEAKLTALSAEGAQAMRYDTSAQGMAAKRTYLEKLRAAMADRKEVMRSFAAKYTNMYISLDILEEYAGTFIDHEEIEPLFNALKDEIKNTSKGKAFQKRISDAKQTAIGTKAPNFTQKDTEGNKVTLSSYKGKYVLLNFWSSFSSPSRMENQELKSILRPITSKELVVIGISLEERKDEWKKAIQEDGLFWLQVSDLNYMKSETAALYGITTVPQNVLIDPDGNIIARNLKGNALEEKLKEIL